MTRTGGAILPLLALLCSTQLANGNILFHFALDFGIHDADGAPNKTIEVNNNEISIINNNTNENGKQRSVEPPRTESPTPHIDAIAGRLPPTDDGWTVYLAPPLPTPVSPTDPAERLVHNIRLAVANVMHELSPVVGRNDVIAAKVKLTTRFLNESSSGPEAGPGTGTGTGERARLLRRFLALAEQLRHVSADKGGERSVEFLLLRYVLRHNGIPELERQANETLHGGPGGPSMQLTRG